MIERINYEEVEGSFIATYGVKGGLIKKYNKPRVGISPNGIWLGHAHPEVIVNDNDNTIQPAGFLRWEWIKRIDISDISQDRYGYIVFVLHDFDAVWDTIPFQNKVSLKSACVRIGSESKVLAYAGHICFDFDEDDYESFVEIIQQNNFAEIRMIGHMDEYYKMSTGQSIWGYVTIGIIVVAMITSLLSFFG